jgi:hypothetical protein
VGDRKEKERKSVDKIVERAMKVEREGERFEK